MRVKLAKLLLDKSADLNIATDEAMNTPLHIACSKNYLILAKYLIEEMNADINA